MRVHLEEFLEFALQRVERGAQCWRQQDLVTIIVLRRTLMGLGYSIIDCFDVHHRPRKVSNRIGAKS